MARAHHRGRPFRHTIKGRPQFLPACTALQLWLQQLWLCFNCDDQYVHGHVCPRLFYLEADDFIKDDKALVEGAMDAALAEEQHVDGAAHAHTLVVSVHALAGITTRCCFW